MEVERKKNCVGLQKERKSVVNLECVSVCAVESGANWTCYEPRPLPKTSLFSGLAARDQLWRSKACSKLIAAAKDPFARDSMQFLSHVTAYKYPLATRQQECRTQLSYIQIEYLVQFRSNCIYVHPTILCS